MRQVFGNSPDETANCRLALNRECTQEAVVMIQPSLQAYAFPGEPGLPIEPQPARPSHLPSCVLSLQSSTLVRAQSPLPRAPEPKRQTLSF